MENLALQDFDLDSVPDIYADILCAEIINLDENRVFEYSGCREFVITLSDNTVSEIYLNELFHERQTHPAYSITLINSRHRYVFFSQKGSRILHIKSKIYALQDSNQSPSEVNLHYLPLNIKIETMTPDDYEPYFPSIKDVIIYIAKSLEGKDAINEIIRRHFENIVIMLLNIRLSIINTVMHSISGIALTNITSVGKQPFELSVSNVYIWSENPEVNNNAKLLQTNNTQHKYIEIPRKSDEYEYEYDILSSEINDSVGKLTVTNSEEFKLWLFPDSNPLYLANYRHKAVLNFKLKCSQSCSILLHLYSIPNYFSISYPLNVVKPNVWQSFLIPIINSNTSNNFNPLVVRAINYIKDNYGAKLTIESIAESLHIHPSYLSAIFKKNTGLSVNSYINNYRITIAKQLLANTENDISTIANMTGFYDSQHFLKTFKKVCGTTPKNFRKNSTVL